MRIHAVEKSSLATQVCFVMEGSTCPVKEIKNAQDKGLFKAKLASIYFASTADHNFVAVGLGKEDKVTVDGTRKAISALYAQLKSLSIDSFFVDYNASLGGNDSHARIFVEAIINANYCFDQLKSEKNTFTLSHIDLVGDTSEQAKEAIRVGLAIASGQNYAKDLKNAPANVCTTDYLLDEAKKIAKSHDKCNLHYIGEDKMLELGMGCITAVGRSSKMPTYIACMEYNGGNTDEKPIVLVGKGLVYDTGGLCLKPGMGMSSMKMDMGGAASVFGTMKTIIELNLPINVVGTVALVENSIGSDAYRPGDVLKSMQGLTVEVGNTDAEGRLALCDALTYIERYNPKSVIDIATLTGAIIVSLGGDITGLFSNNDALTEELKTASKESNDNAWQLPLHAPYHEQLKSDVADMNNIGSSGAGSITAAIFLSKFTEKYNWAHLDIAGSAMMSFDKPTATGRPVPMLTQYIMNQIK